MKAVLFLMTILLLKMTMCKSQAPQENAKNVNTTIAFDSSNQESSEVPQQFATEIWEKSMNFNTYKEAIENAQPNDTIIIPPGTYRINKTIEINTDRLTILGNRTTLISKVSQNIFMANNVDHLTVKSISTISISPARSFLIKAQGGNNLNISNCDTKGMGLVGLYKNQFEDIHENLNIDSCNVINAGAHGVLLQNVDQFKITNSRFINCKGDGIKTNTPPCKNGYIFNCYFESNDDDGFDLFGGGSDIIIDSCRFVDQKLQLKNIGGQYYRPQVGNCIIKRSYFVNSSIICLSKYIPGTEFKGLSGIKIDSNQWINRLNSCFQSNGAVNFEFTNNKVLLTESQQAIDIRPPLGVGLISNNTFESEINYLETNPKKGTYLLATKEQSDKKYGTLDEKSTLIIKNNTFINGRRDFKLEGLANFRVLNNRSSGQSDQSRYQGVLKIKDSNKKYIRETNGNVLEQ